jgi:hypothetical protein
VGTPQEALELLRQEEKETPMQALARLREAEAAGFQVDSSPFPLPPPRQGNVQGGPMLGEIPLQPDSFSPTQRADAARGVDVTTDLQDVDLRSAIGFSPNEAFTYNFLKTKLSEKSGIPEEQVLRQNERGGFEWLNPQTGRYTPVDGANLTANDFRDLYGPSATVTPAVVGGIGGTIVNPTVGTVAGASGAWFGEILRLNHGRELGVHDLNNEEMAQEATSIAQTDLLFGAAGQVAAKAKVLFNAIFRPKAFSPKEAGDILDGVGQNKALVDDLNETLELAGRDARFKLDPVADSGSALGLEQREAAAKLTNASKALRAEEIAANQTALEEYARLNLGIDLEANLVTNAGTADAARLSQNALKAERARIQEIANTNVLKSQQVATDALSAFKMLDQEVAGANTRTIVSLHEDALKSRKDALWGGYQEAIGHSPTIFKSKVKIPVSHNVSLARGRLARQRKQSTLTRTAAGGKALKDLKKGKPVDLAILDEDIKTLRALSKTADSGISGNQLRGDRDLLVKMRNDWLRKNDPATLGLLEQAEEATRIHSRFINDSAFSAMVKTNADDTLVMDNVGAFKQIFQEQSGETMRQLVQTAKNTPGGVASLQETTLRLYKANVVPAGSQFPDLRLHKQFVKNNENALRALFPDNTNMLQFGRLSQNIERTVARQKATRTTLAKSDLGKLAGANPESMGKMALGGSISEDGLRTSMRRVKAAGPEVVESFEDAFGREVYARISSSGVVSTSQISTFLKTNAVKYDIVMGPGASHRLEMLAKGLELNAATATGKQLPATTLLGQLSRAIITPPLTRRGRAQTLLEKMRVEAGARILGRAVRDEDMLRQLVLNGGNDIRDERVLSLLSQWGATSLAVDQDL